MYNIYTYLILGVAAFITGYIIRNKWQIKMFQFGIIFNFIYILAILILQEEIVNNLWLITLLSGISMSTYYFPMNLFSVYKIKNEERLTFEIKIAFYKKLISIIAPIVLGMIITTTNFILTAIIILFLSFLQIILSFFLTSEDQLDNTFNGQLAWQKFMKDKRIKKVLFLDFLLGFSDGNSAVVLLHTILIIQSFQTDVKLGIYTSIASALSLVALQLYKKYLTKKKNNWICFICAIIPIIAAIILTIYKNDFTLLTYYFVFTIFNTILVKLTGIEVANVGNCEMILKHFKIEYLAFHELVLNTGRIISYVLLLCVYILNPNSLEYLLIALLGITIFQSIVYQKIKKQT